jgi:hypothetical protein
MLRRSTPSGNLYLIQYSQNKAIDIMDHLSCFVPGMLALGAQGPNETLHLTTAKELMMTCFDMYACQSTGLAPEAVRFKKGFDFEVSNPSYFLRPETIESLFILYRKTKDEKYR